MECRRHPLTPAKIVAIATDKYLTQTHATTDPSLPGSPVIKYGQDFTFGTGRAAPEGHDLKASEADLKSKMEKLLDVFAGSDGSGMAKRLFGYFLAKQTKPVYFDDAGLNSAAGSHKNIEHFMRAALGSPGFPQPAAGVTRIHQALKKANWDIRQLSAPTDLGVPAFNDGNKFWGTGDFGNGLGVMINGVQHAFVVATHYHHDPAERKYCITLKYTFYDVFGLDDDDLKEYGAKEDGWFTSAAAEGITAWWQLQHQHNYAPLVTRIVVERSFTAPAT